MNIKVKFPLDNNSYTDARLPTLGLMLLLISFGILYVDMQFQNFRVSIFLSTELNMTQADYRSLCNMPYDEYRCSVLSIKSNSSIKCINDIEAMTGHILPLVSYALQIYLIYTLLSFTGNYNHILTDIFWVAAVFVFVLIAIAVHGGRCLHSYTSCIICATGVCVFGFVIYLVGRSNREYPYRGHRHTHPGQGAATANDDRQIMITNAVP